MEANSLRSPMTKKYFVAVHDEYEVVQQLYRVTNINTYIDKKKVD